MNNRPFFFSLDPRMHCTSQHSSSGSLTSLPGEWVASTGSHIGIHGDAGSMCAHAVVTADTGGVELFLRDRAALFHVVSPLTCRLLREHLEHFRQLRGRSAIGEWRC